MSERRPVLVVQHEDECPPAWFGEWLDVAGVRLDVRRAHDGEPLPSRLTDHGGLLVLGGAMGAGDDATCPWLTDTKRLLAEAVATGVPTLGICLGHQLLAVASGGRVDAHAAGRQCGLLPVGWTDEARADALFGPLVRAGGYDEQVAVQWNVDVVTGLPPGAVPLAHAAGAVQAMRVSPSSWGIQSHPEADADIVARWIRQGPTPAGPPEHRLLADLAAGEQRVRVAWERLARGFARQVRAAGTLAPAEPMTAQR